MPFTSLWGMGEQERAEGPVRFTLEADHTMVTQAVRYRGLWVQKGATSQYGQSPASTSRNCKIEWGITGPRPLSPGLVDAPESSMMWQFHHSITRHPQARAEKDQGTVWSGPK